MDGKASGLMEKQFKNPAVTGKKTERMKERRRPKNKQTDKTKKKDNSPVETFLQTVSALLTAANATAAMHFLWTA